MKYRGRSAGSSGRGPADGVEHLLAALADGEAAEREPVERQRDEPLDRAAAQLGVGAALRDPEAELTRSPRRVDLALGPELRPSHGLLVLARRDVRGRADVEAHRDVRPEPALDLGRRAPASGAPSLPS